MADLTKAYLGLGANLGDPMQQLVDARDMLSRWLGTHALRSSNFYLSSPVGNADQPDFVNAVLELSTDRTADELFSEMQRVEQRLGRTRCQNNQNAPRLIDIDMLLFGSHVIAQDDLVVPHPRMLERLFVLMPLADLISEHRILGKLSKLLTGNQFADQQLRSMVL